MKKPLVLVGGGGHCRSCIDVIDTTGAGRIIGIVDLKDRVGRTVGPYSVIGSDEDLPRLVKKYGRFLITLGGLTNLQPRRDLFERLRKMGAEFPVVVSPRAHVSSTAKVGAGTIVMHGALINAGAEVRENCIINTFALVEHDAFIDGHTHLSTGAVINGEARVGAGVLVGSGATVIQGVCIADGAVIGAGACVIEDIARSGTYVGVPARRI